MALNAAETLVIKLKDRDNWDSMTPDEQYLLTFTLAGQNALLRLMREILMAKKENLEIQLSLITEPCMN